MHVHGRIRVTVCSSASNWGVVQEISPPSALREGFHKWILQSLKECALSTECHEMQPPWQNAQQQSLELASNVAGQHEQLHKTDASG